MESHVRDTSHAKPDVSVYQMGGVIRGGWFSVMSFIYSGLLITTTSILPSAWAHTCSGPSPLLALLPPASLLPTVDMGKNIKTVADAALDK